MCFLAPGGWRQGLFTRAEARRVLKTASGTKHTPLQLRLKSLHGGKRNRTHDLVSLAWSSSGVLCRAVLCRAFCGALRHLRCLATLDGLPRVGRVGPAAILCRHVTLLRQSGVVVWLVSSFRSNSVLQCATGLVSGCMGHRVKSKRLEVAQVQSQRSLYWYRNFS